MIDTRKDITQTGELFLFIRTKDQRNRNHEYAFDRLIKLQQLITGSCTEINSDFKSICSKK